MGRRTAVQAIVLWVIACSAVYLLFSRDTETNNDFESFDNDTGTRDGSFLVPNYVHFLRFGQGEVSFVDAVCILAAFKRQRPHRLYIHTDQRLRGRHWDVVRRTPGFSEALRVTPVVLPEDIFGQKINPKWRRYHGGDVTRLRILMRYGGIFLDNDSYLVSSLDDFRRYEMAIGWQPGKHLQNQVIVAHKDARFLRLWLNSYRESYLPEQWYYNAGELPTKEILEKRPGLVHRVDTLFGVYGIVRKVFQTMWPEWRNYYAIHLQVRHQSLLKNLTAEATFPVRFTDRNIHRYPIAFRDMAYDVYPFPPRKGGSPPKKRSGKRRNLNLAS